MQAIGFTTDTGNMLRAYTPAMTFGRNVARLREAKGWSQSELARQLKLPPTDVNRLERGFGWPSSRTILKYRNALGCSFDDLYQGITDIDDLSNESTGPVGKNINGSPAGSRTELIHSPGLSVDAHPGGTHEHPAIPARPSTHEDAYIAALTKRLERIERALAGGQDPNPHVLPPVLPHRTPSGSGSHAGKHRTSKPKRRRGA